MTSSFGSRRRLSGAEVLEYIWQLPSDDDDSETEADDGGQEELQMLDDAACLSSSPTDHDDVPVADIEDESPEIIAVSHPDASDITVSHPDAGDITDEDEAEPESWRDETEHFQQLPEKSEKQPSVDQSITSSDSAGKYFEAIFDNDICDLIVQQTNLYRTQKQATGSSSATNADDITAGDIKAWIGLCILMGIHQLPQLQNYWSSDPLLGLTAVSKVMSSKKFKKITEIIHLNDNTTNPPRTEANHDKLHKVRPLIEKLEAQLTALYQPSGTVSVDESMIPFKGRSSLKQYMPMKPVKRGYKVWCLADAVTGFVYTFQVYTGRSEEKNAYTLGSRSVSEGKT